MTAVDSRHRYLILAGTTRSGSTAIFEYLATHPEIAIPSIKETRFFLDPDYPVARRWCRFEDGFAAYDKLFAPGPVRLDASPDYLYSPGTPERIAALLPEARLVFVLRDPIERLVSWYRYGRQRGMLSPDIDFSDYIEWQYSGKAPREQIFCALEQGRYAPYLGPYLERFGPERVRVYFFEEFIADPRATVEQLCAFAGIDPAYYRRYEFRVVNESREVRSTRLNKLVVTLMADIRSRYRQNPALRRFLRSLWRGLVEPVYSKLNAKPPEQVAISPQLRSLLNEYYAEDARALVTLLGRPVAWNHPALLKP